MKQLDFTYEEEIRKKVKIYIGRDSSKEIVDFLTPLSPDKVFIVCDTTIAKLYAVQMKATLSKKYDTHILVHAPDEVNKNLEAIVKMSNEFFTLGGTSKSCICALGGGITGNMAGLFATIAFRGIQLVHVPTSLLAQVDSAVGVEQSVSSPQIKNSLGSLKAPDLVIIDPLLIKSLPEREIRAGLGEAIKHGFSQNMDLADFIVSMDIHDLNALEHVITRTLDLKLEHWKDTPDIWDTTHKVVRLTYLGHTAGKVIEKLDIDYLTHGEAISHGMVIEAYMSYKLGLLDMVAVTKMKEYLEKLQLLYPLSKKYSASSILSRLYPSSDEPTFALLQGLGNPATLSRRVPKKIAEEALEWYIPLAVQEP